MSTNQAVCGQCGASYAVSLDPGATFMCGACGAVVTVENAPAAEELELEMIAEGEAAPRPVVPPRVAPSVQPKAPRQVAPTPQGIPRAASLEDAVAVPRRLTPATGSGLSHSEILHSTSKRNPWVILSVIGGLLIAGVVVTWLALRPSDAEREASYVAGYVAGQRASFCKTFNEEVEDAAVAWESHAAAATDAVEKNFVSGYEDALAGIAPMTGEDAIEAQRFDCDFLIAVVNRNHDPETADGAFAGAARLTKEAKRWKKRGAPEEMVTLISDRAQALSRAVLKIDPNHARTRELRGHSRYDGTLARFVEADWLDPKGREQASKLHQRLTRLAAADHGWIAREQVTSLEALQKELATKERAWKAESASPFGQAASKLAEDTIAKLDALWTKSRNLENQKDPKARAAMKALLDKLGGKSKWTFTVVTEKPFVLFIQDDSSTDAPALGLETAKRLRALHKAFLAEHGATFALEPIDTPVPVVHLHDKDAYQVYNIGKMGAPTAAEAHYEPDEGRLVLHGSTDFTTTLHEATHQIVDHYTENKPKFLSQSFWFQEGIAEWFGGASRSVDRESGEFVYETGVLQKKRLTGTFAAALSGGRQFSLKRLVGMTYAARNAAMMTGRMDKVLLVYTQGWALIYFMNHFDVDAEGLVRCPRAGEGLKGRYAKGWERYLRFELKGKDGKPFTGRKAFMEAFSLDDAGLEKMDKEFEAYQEFLVRKLNLGQYEGKYLVPWNEYVNSSGEKTGEKEDDLLIQ